MKKVIKSLLITLLALIAACAVALAVLWQSYTPSDPLETTAAESGDLDVATKVSVQLQLTDPNARAKDRIVKKSEKDGFYTALDVGCVWLDRALNSK